MSKLGDSLLQDVDNLVLGLGQLSWDILNWLSDSSDNLSDLLDLSGDLSDSPLKGGNLLLQDWSLFNWSSWKLFLLDVVDSLLDGSNLLDQLVNGLLDDSDDLSLSWSWLLWLLWLLWDNWLLESDSLDDVSDVNDLLVDLSDDSGQFNNLLLQHWLLLFWSGWKLSSQSLDGVLDSGDLLEQFGNLLSESLNNLLLRLGNLSWDSWKWSWLWGSWLVSDSGDGPLDVLDGLVSLVDNSSQDCDSLLSLWLLLFWKSWELSGELLDDLLDLGDSLSQDSGLLGQVLNDSSVNWGKNGWLGAWLLVDWLWLGENFSDVVASVVSGCGGDVFLGLGNLIGLIHVVLLGQLLNMLSESGVSGSVGGASLLD